MAAEYVHTQALGIARTDVKSLRASAMIIAYRRNTTRINATSSVADCFSFERLRDVRSKLARHIAFDFAMSHIQAISGSLNRDKNECCAISACAAIQCYAGIMPAPFHFAWFEQYFSSITNLILNRTYRNSFNLSVSCIFSIRYQLGYSAA